VGLVDQKSGASVNVIVEDFLVKHKDGSLSQVDFVPAPADTLELTAAEALDALRSEQFTLPTDADSLIVVYSFASEKASGFKQSDSPVEIQFSVKTMGGTVKEQLFSKLLLTSDSPVAQSEVRISVAAKPFDAGEAIAFGSELRNQKADGLTVSRGHLYDLSRDGTESQFLQTNQQPNQADEFNLLFANYPNPFNPETTIRYEIANAAHVQITIYNLLGEEIRTLENRVHAAGSYTIRWDGKDGSGKDMASGVYLARIKAGATSNAIKMTLVR